MKQELYQWLYQMDLQRSYFSKDEALKAAMLNTVRFYEMVHSRDSHLVGPVNLHELLMDPENGYFEVKAGSDRESLMQDVDSVKFMPPEVINMKSRWSMAADRFVLAELLFALRYCKHPYDGRKVLKHPILDVKAAKQLYGNCLFIFDPNDSSNGLDYYADPGPIELWKHDCNVGLKDAFLQVFTRGYYDINMRLSDSAWRQLLE